MIPNARLRLGKCYAAEVNNVQSAALHMGAAFHDFWGNRAWPA